VGNIDFDEDKVVGTVTKIVLSKKAFELVEPMLMKMNVNAYCS
jgi:hypothetical protein